MVSDTTCPALFKIPSDSPDHKPMNGISEKSDQAQKTEEKKNILCRQCLQVITSPDDRLYKKGSHQHTFVNPHGIVFRIGCFQTASGCCPTGMPSDEFSWFTGYRWRIGICGRCKIHIGWQFLSKTDSFFGLILDNLIFP